MVLRRDSKPSPHKFVFALIGDILNNNERVRDFCSQAMVLIRESQVLKYFLFMRFFEL